MTSITNAPSVSRGAARKGRAPAPRGTVHRGTGSAAPALRACRERRQARAEAGFAGRNPRRPGKRGAA